MKTYTVTVLTDAGMVSRNIQAGTAASAVNQMITLAERAGVDADNADFDIEVRPQEGSKRQKTVSGAVAGRA